MRVHPSWKVLSPIDLAQDAELLAAQAMRVAAAAGGDLTLLYVAGQDRSPYSKWPANTVPPAAGRNIRRVVLEGPLAETVSSFADAMEADLIVLPRVRRQRWGWKRPAAGKIAAATDRPVCLTSVGREVQFRDLLCVVALDGSDGPLLEAADEYARRWRSSITLLHVLPARGEDLLAYGAALAPDRPLTERAACERMRGLSAALPSAATQVVTGSPRAAIARAARELPADFVVASRGGDAGPLLLRLPWTAFSIARPASSLRPAVADRILVSER
jgi:nucleotide-binding universal stress UspA family protein